MQVNINSCDVLSVILTFKMRDYREKLWRDGKLSRLLSVVTYIWC